MKSPVKNDETEVRVELKYCERCGGLWFRREGSNAAFCGPCTASEPEVAGRYERRQNQQEWLGPMTGVIRNLQGAVETEGACA